MQERPQFRPRRFGHSNVFIGSVQKSMDFYLNAVGLEECFQEPAIKAGFMGNGNTHHDIGLTQVSKESLLGNEGQVLVPEDFGNEPGLFHVAFEMENESELVTAHEKLLKWDVPILMTVDHTLAKSVYLVDPENNVIEFTSDATKDWRKTFDEYEGRLVTGPWTPGENAPDSGCHYPVAPQIRRVDSALVHSTKTTHCVIGCEDFQSQLAFYRDVGGFDDVLCSDRAGIAVLKGTADPYSLVLYEVRKGEKPGYTLMGYEVSEEDFDADMESFEKAGFAIEGRVDHPSKKSVFVRDPDGLGIEFSTPVSEVPTDLDGDDLRHFWLVAA